MTNLTVSCQTTDENVFCSGVHSYTGIPKMRDCPSVKYGKNASRMAANHDNNTDDVDWKE